MSESTENLRRKIDGARDLQSVVRSMKALAASNIGQYEKAVKSLDDYFRTIELGLSVCLRGLGPAPRAIGKITRDVPAVGAIIFGSDQGLVGRFNEVLVEFASDTLRALPEKVKKVWAIGERIHALMSESGLPEAALFPVPTSAGTITPLIGRILIEIETARERGEVTDVYLFHNHPKSGAVYESVGKKLLPLDKPWRDQLVALQWPTKILPEVIEGATPTLQAFIRGYFFVVLFQACAESLASENASRLASMQRAETNIEDILEELDRSYHRIRQEGIDEELFDVISGYEALSKAR
jgi:F-type H+-transporting ATPase subunit gamma